jgi:hypothetical protein
MAAVGNLANYAFEKGVAEAEKVSYKQTAYPAQIGRSSHRKLISDPTANWTVIPDQPDHFGA